MEIATLWPGLASSLSGGPETGRRSASSKTARSSSAAGRYAGSTTVVRSAGSSTSRPPVPYASRMRMPAPYPERRSYMFSDHYGQAHRPVRRPGRSRGIRRVLRRASRAARPQGAGAAPLRGGPRGRHAGRLRAAVLPHRRALVRQRGGDAGVNGHARRTSAGSRRAELRHRRGDGPDRGDRLSRAPAGGLRLFLILGAVSALGPASMDIYLPSLPTLARELGTTESSAQLTVSLFLVGLGLGQLVA